MKSFLLLTSLLISAAVCLPSSSRTSQCNDGHHFTCNTGACIPMEWMCDNVPDCPKKDDEAQCSQEHTCLPDQFKCKNDDCVSSEKKCDGHSDCLDGSDEAGCEEMKTLTTPFPPSSSTSAAASLCNDDHHFTCNNGSCIPMEWMCDNHPDCLEAEDETPCQNFHKCSAEQFKCKNDVCVPLNAKCNGHQECLDGSDEFGCTGVFAPSTTSAPASSNSSTTNSSAVAAVNDAGVSFGTYLFYFIVVVAVLGLCGLAFNYIRKRRNHEGGAVKYKTLENAVYNDEQS